MLLIRIFWEYINLDNTVLQQQQQRNDVYIRIKYTIIWPYLNDSFKTCVRHNAPKNNQEAARACDSILIRFYGTIFKVMCKRSAETSRLGAAVTLDGKSRGTQNLPGRAAACLWFQGERKNTLMYSFYINKHEELWRETLR